MQHILNLAFDFDDERIINGVEGAAEKEIIKLLTQKVEKKIFGRRNGYYGNDEENYLGFASKHLDDFLEKHKDTIIKATSDKLVEKIYRTKAFKEKIDNTLESKS